MSEDSQNQDGESSQAGKLIPFALGFFFGPLGLHRLWLGLYKSGGYMLALSSLALFEFSRDSALVERIQRGEVPEHLSRALILASVILFVTSVWATLDCVKLVVGKFVDGSGRRITRW